MQQTIIALHNRVKACESILAQLQSGDLELNRKVDTSTARRRHLSDADWVDEDFNASGRIAANNLASSSSNDDDEPASANVEPLVNSRKQVQMAPDKPKTSKRSFVRSPVGTHKKGKYS